MKITFILPNLSLTGGVRVVCIFAELLKKRGHSVHVVAAPFAVPTLKQQFKSLIRGNGWISTPKDKSSFSNRIDVDYKVIDSCRPIEDKDVPDSDVIVATWWETAEWIAKLSPSKGAKAYFIQHYETFDYLPRERVEATWRLPMHKITISQWLVDLARIKYGDSQVSIAPPSVDVTQFFAPPRGKQKIPTVGMLYSSVQWKGTDIALKAFSLAAEKIPNLHLVAFGEYAPSLKLPLPAVAEYKIQPEQNAIKDYYSKCDVWLLASRSEGFGLPIIEAMACRTPIISTPAGAAPEILSGGAGILLNSESPEEMAKAIESIIKLSDSDWRAMSGAALEKIQSYTWDDAAVYFEDALDVAIKKSKNKKYEVNFHSPYHEKRG